MEGGGGFAIVVPPPWFGCEPVDEPGLLDPPGADSPAEPDMDGTPDPAGSPDCESPEGLPCVTAVLPPFREPVPLTLEEHPTRPVTVRHPATSTAAVEYFFTGLANR